MSLLDFLLSGLSLRSFTSIWYWIVVLAFWLKVTMRPLGVPADVVLRAKFGDEAALLDVEAFAMLQIRRVAYFADQLGPWIVGAIFFVGTGLAVLGWGFGVQIARAAMLLFLSMLAVGGLTLLRARRIFIHEPRGEALLVEVLKHRMWCRMLALLALLLIFFIALVEMVLSLPF